MHKKGVVLIVDDCFDEKIGQFEEHLQRAKFEIRKAETLEEADRELDKLLRDNSLNGIILDFSFPKDVNDDNVSENGKPNGIVLLEKYRLRLELKRIPVVINTTGDEDYKEKYLGFLKQLYIPIYNVKHQVHPLANPLMRMTQDIIKMFNQRYEQRKLSSQTIKDGSWLARGKNGTYDRKTGKYYYNRDGD